MWSAPHTSFIYLPLLLIVLLAGCGPVTAIALLQNNTDLLDLVRQASPPDPSAEKRPEKKTDVNEQT